jgi:hypothetical protein
MWLISKISLGLLFGSCVYEYIIVEKLRKSDSVTEYKKYLKMAGIGMAVVVILVIISIALICTR